MRLAIDTNVVESALLWGGTQKSLIALREMFEVDFYTSLALRDGFADVLLRGKLDARIAAMNATRVSLLRYFCSAGGATDRCMS